MKEVLDVYMRRIPYNIRTIGWRSSLPPSALHFHTIPTFNDMLYIHNRTVYIVDLGNVREIVLYVS